MFCSQCGTQLPNDAQFCIKCGTRQGAGLQRGQPREIRWEWCHIEFENMRTPNGSYAGKDRWVAWGTVSACKYIVATSQHFYDSPSTFGRYQKKAFDDLVLELFQDGWEIVSQGTLAEWSAFKFKRMITPERERQTEMMINLREAKGLLDYLREKRVDIGLNSEGVIIFMKNVELKPETKARVERLNPHLSIILQYEAKGVLDDLRKAGAKIELTSRSDCSDPTKLGHFRTQIT